MRPPGVSIAQSIQGLWHRQVLKHLEQINKVEAAELGAERVVGNITGVPTRLGILRDESTNVLSGMVHADNVPRAQTEEHPDQLPLAAPHIQTSTAGDDATHFDRGAERLHLDTFVQAAQPWRARAAGVFEKLYR